MRPTIKVRRSIFGGWYLVVKGFHFEGKAGSAAMRALETLDAYLRSRP